MRKVFAVICAFVFLLGGIAAAEQVVQKAPDFVMEGYDGDSANHDWTNNRFFTSMQERTGISFQFTQHADFTEWTNRKKELLEGVNLPDVLFKASLTTAETQALYSKGYIIDLKPYLAEYAPNLWALLQGNEAWMKALTLEDGSIPALPMINTLQTNDAMWINTTWLRRLGMEVPTTADELTEVLRAFREKDPNNNGSRDEIPLTFIGMWELRFLGHAFGIIDNDYYVTARDGQVTSSLTTDENRAFLTWLHTLWEERLLDHNGFNMADSMRQITDEKKPIPYGMMMSSNPLTVVPSAALKQFSMLMPLTYDGKQEYRSLLGDLVRGTFAITSACKEPEKLVAWVDYLYTEEGSLEMLYGREGEEYVWREDGLWEWNHDIETVAREILPQNTLSEGGEAPGLLNKDFQTKYAEEDARRSITELAELVKISTLPYPYVFLSSEDAARIAEIQQELAPYAETGMARFVTGDVPLDDEHWNEFCQGVRDHHLDEAVAIWQKYLK